MDAAKICDIGGRTENQDYAAIYTQNQTGCFIVADGLGGHGGGELASEAAALAVLRHFHSQPSCTKDCLAHCFAAAHQAVLQKASETAFSGMRTTLAVLLIEQDTAIWGHIGDSRIYYFHNNTLTQVTADHSVAYLAYLNGEIKYQDIRHSPDQNRLIRSIGAGKECKPALGEAVSLTPGDTFLLCSDGFWELLSEKEMLSSLKKSSTASRWLAKMLRIANEKRKRIPDHDNFSAITIWI
ncbi:PP2C family protein-serine/threonine phosphatase [Ructibacterium gallinarum]|uniref:Serine/threonine-protein phosphatase n=1 Tax=Ructibacterium gallinarum TaxID=2779355 RepID=A0A9D5M1C4_9FIRM|nr:protein phosphatase 2C domain-containing protein [Ructibacterium gallinarum]MBE5040326.1 serine/threonine-protein phosphatase [Ructibacterium gallinarum]